MSPLRREIGKWDFVALVLNSIVGAGIFGLPARAYTLAGVYSLVAYAVCGLAIFLIILCFAEVSSRFTETGGLYLYARETFGKLAGFEIGWLAWLVRLTAFAALCNLFADYFSYFVPAAAAGSGRVVVVVAVVCLLAGTGIAGVRLTSIFTNVVTVGKLVPLVLLVVVGVCFIDSRQYSEALPANPGGLSATALLLLFAFTGFENAVVPAGEGRDPRRHLPFALMVGIGIVVVLYIAIQAVCIGVLPQLASSQRPLADAGRELFGGAGAALISLGALISIMGTMNTVMIAAPRLLFAMAEQHQLPPMFSATHRRFGTPHVAIVLSAAGMLGLTLSGSFAASAVLSTVIRLTTYAMTCVAFLVLRRRHHFDHDARFIVPAGVVVSSAALLLIAWLFTASSWADVHQALAAGAVGAVLYAAYAGRQRGPALVDAQIPT